ncbi:hypothetical protein LOK49_LG13G01233 [Camellia lanceoleosa]|uniref:Uncharacterized protein n=1 Tax=Camellia lanceoleosa TaxID=1840588 RepID=A0ACC0FH57_9ERIC|nr:hypothetical protein LOK49_LG13G01233 [Camellia lanceoleosa]
MTNNFYVGAFGKSLTISLQDLFYMTNILVNISLFLS